jgi:hypothetical protein
MGENEIDEKMKGKWNRAKETKRNQNGIKKMK